MKRSSTLFLKAVVLLIAVAVFFGMIRFPQTEGRAANLDLISIYLRDPFIIYIYIASIPFFVALFQSFKLLGYVEKNKIFSQASVKAVRNIKYSAIATIGFIIGAEVFIILSHGDDDMAGGVATGLFIIFASLIVVATADVFERLLQKAVNK